MQEANDQQLEQINITVTKRNAIWEASCDKVNIVGENKKNTK